MTPTTMHCSTAQGNLHALPLSAAKQADSRLVFLLYTYEDMLTIHACNDLDTNALLRKLACLTAQRCSAKQDDSSLVFLLLHL